LVFGGSVKPFEFLLSATGDSHFLTYNSTIKDEENAMRPTRMNRVGLVGLFLAAGLTAGLTGCGLSTERTLYEGQMAYDDKNYELAEQKVSQVLSEDDTDWKALLYMGKIRLAQGRSAEAIVPLQKSLGLVEDEPDNAALVLDALAEAYLQQKQYNTLASMLQHQVNERGELRDYLRQAKYLGKMGDSDSAVLAYRKAIRFAGPRNDAAYLALADYLGSVGETDKEILALRKALYISPGKKSTADRLRKFGIVPGPAAAVRPDDSEFAPDTLNR
jgi:tetratricopeptide (TPR) repeat protein